MYTLDTADPVITSYMTTCEHNAHRTVPIIIANYGTTYYTNMHTRTTEPKNLVVWIMQVL
jgi:hypothetical protein